MENKSTSTPYIFNAYSLYHDLKNITDKIIVDFGGGSPLSKTVIMASLILKHNLKNYVEIGVYRGRSFFPMAFAEQQIGGMAYGIDPYELEAAKEFDLTEDLSKTVNTFLDEVNLPQMFVEVSDFLNENNFSDSAKILRTPSEIAVNYFTDQQIEIEMLHIDGNHDTKFVQLDADLYIPLVKKGGFIVFDDINWPSVEIVFNQYKDQLQTIFNNGEFAILYNNSDTDEYSIQSIHELSIANAIVKKFDQNDFGLIPFGANTTTPKISVIVPTSNNQDVIANCLDGILAQKGIYQLEVIIVDDCSTDGTPQIIDKYCKILPLTGIRVDCISSDEKIGIVGIIEKALDHCTGDFISICESRDYWFDDNRLQKGIDFLNDHADISFCFLSDHFIYEENGVCKRYELKENLSRYAFKPNYQGNNIHISNLSCCLLSSKSLEFMSLDFFNQVSIDWLMNLYFAQFDKQDYLNEIIAIFEKQKNVDWYKNSNTQQWVELCHFIDEYNVMHNYTFNKELEELQIAIEAQDPAIKFIEKYDLLIYDDIFPNPLSPFRYQEFCSYLTEFENIKILSSGHALIFFGNAKINNLIINYKRENPEYAKKLSLYTPGMSLNARLFYTVFLNNVFDLIEEIEKHRLPFVFTLYPGGGFGLGAEQSDNKLKRVTSSPYFKKVIVTQKITYDYLLRKGYCKPDQIIYLYGIVSPKETKALKSLKKEHFGYDKNTLDIVFGAHKYMPHGVDKGYDIFIKVAKRLSSEFENINFHVFGDFDQNDLDVSEIKERITFYGAHNIDWFDDFFRDKDIILSPNLSGMIHEGSFDGFPTGTCTEAALRETAIFCTDELNQNQHYIDGEDIVIVPHNQDRIVDLIKHYYNNPGLLKSIAQNGRKKVIQLYSYESQLLPRIQLIKEHISKSDYFAAQYTSKLESMIKTQEAVIQSFEIQKSELDKQIGEMSCELITKNNELITKNNMVNEKNKELAEIYNSKAWKFALVIRRVRVKIAPQNSFQMRMLKFLLRSKQKQNHNNDLYLINSSDLFDRDWYLAQYPDIESAKVDPAKHYLLWGGNENRDPGPNFSTSYYLEKNPDVKAAGINPLVHYLKAGKNEGRQAKPEQ